MKYLASILFLFLDVSKYLPRFSEEFPLPLRSSNFTRFFQYVDLLYLFYLNEV